MTLAREDALALRQEVASWPLDASTDAHGNQAATAAELYAPPSHAAALDPKSPIVRGSRGTGKSFWSSVLGDSSLRRDAASAYPRLGLDRVDVRFGFTGLSGPHGIDKEKLDSCIGETAGPAEARRFWWATMLRAVGSSLDGRTRSLRDWYEDAGDIEKRETILSNCEASEQQRNHRLLIVYDALDTVATEWPRRRVLTEALFEVVWAMRAYANIRPKIFVRPDQLDDDALTFVEMPKLRTAAVRLTWNTLDLYALLFVRLMLGGAKEAFGRLLAAIGQPAVTREKILAHDWLLLNNEDSQREVIAALAGQHMASGTYGHKKGSTYEWPMNHLSDAFDEVTPRSLLALMIGAAQREPPPDTGIFKPDGIRHGLRLASKMRVDQLHLEFKWIKGVLAPLSGLLLPKEEDEVASVWRRAGTIASVLEDAKRFDYLPPFPREPQPRERDLITALESIGVMSRRSDNRVDMPDLFRIAAKLLKKGGTAPL